MTPQTGHPGRGTDDADGRPTGIAEDSVALAMTEMWRSVLHLDQVEPDDNFFDLGGTSILAARVSAAIGERYGIDPVDILEILFEAADLHETAGLLNREIEDRAGRAG